MEQRIFRCAVSAAHFLFSQKVRGIKRKREVYGNEKDRHYYCDADLIPYSKQELYNATVLYGQELSEYYFLNVNKYDEQIVEEVDEEARKAYYDELAVVGPEKMHEKLAKLDPKTAAEIHPNNTRRVIRAICTKERMEITLTIFLMS